jgi:copper homeostasis protein (lipoprotein)
MSPGLRIRSLIIAALACGASAAGAAEISGTAVFRERPALPPKAVFEASLMDSSRMDAPATVLGQVRLTDPPAPPISFRIRFDRANYDARHQYFVRARILVDGKPLFVTDRDYRVLERGVDHSVAVTLVRAPRESGTPERAFTDLPADFIGALPCSDCAGIRHTLRLLPGHGFHLAITRLRSGDDVTTWERGTWNQSSDGRMLRLDTGRGRSVRYTIVDRSTLRALDDDGAPVSTRPGNDLRRARSAVPLEPRGRMKGMYRSMADAGSFVDCATGQRLVVAHEADNAALERAYSEHRPGPGAEVQVTVDGRIAMRPRMEGSGEEAALIVERFVDIRPAERCGTGRVMSSLDATRWVPSWIGERRIKLHAGTREPYLVLEARSRKVTGFGGCNRFNGTFERSGDALRLGPLASTRMACPGGSFDENEFLAALEATRSWRVLGTELTLFDEQGAVAARFEARDL